jgi:DNA-binding transcriptional LysR family regulator
MRERVRQLVEDAEALLRPEGRLDLLALQRTFTLRTSDGIAETFGPSLIRAIRHEAPGVSIRFIRKLDKDSQGLRDGSIDLETGVVDGAIGPEVRAQSLFADRYVAAVSPDHPLSRIDVTSADYASWPHVVTWRQGLDLGGVDERLAAQGLSRRIVASVDGFATALALARGSDLVATVPERHTSNLRHNMHSFALPLPVQPFTISLLWHPRMESDPAHVWLRQLVRKICVS